jgi:hypothetical protein
MPRKTANRTAIVMVQVRGDEALLAGSRRKPRSRIGADDHGQMPGIFVKNRLGFLFPFYKRLRFLAGERNLLRLLPTKVAGYSVGSDRESSQYSARL